jgi:hypothetical protein
MTKRVIRLRSGERLIASTELPMVELAPFVRSGAGQ